MKQIETLKSYVTEGHVTEEQAEFINSLLNGNFNFYDNRMKFMLSEEERRKVDSATPSDLNNELAKVLPRQQFPQLAFSYIENRTFGSYLNLDRLFLTKMYSLFK